MKITIIGTGYVGLVTGTCLADLGHNIICVDKDLDKINKLKKGILTIYEVGLKELLDRNIREERLSFTDSIKEGLKSPVIFIAVGTPEDKDGNADLKYILEVAKDIGKHIQDEKIIVTKSTVPIGTSYKIKEEILKTNKNAKIDIVSNPEFLKEGSAVNNFFNPDRIIVGAETENAREIMKEIYRGIERTGRPIMFTDVKSSEIIKYASNAMLTTRISFINMISELCEKAGANVREVSRGIGLDSRIGPKFLHAGIGYGGSCFPKDIKAFINTLDDKGCNSKLLKAVEDVNQTQRKRFIERILSKINVKGKTIAVLGLAFKPKTDDMREAPSIDIINALLKKGARIKAFDPVALENAKKTLKGIEFCKKSYDCLKGADALIINTEWDEFRNLDFQKVKELMKSKVIFDGRNIYDSETMKKQGFKYYSIGRPDIE